MYIQYILKNYQLIRIYGPKGQSQLIALFQPAPVPNRTLSEQNSEFLYFKQNYCITNLN